LPRVGARARGARMHELEPWRHERLPDDPRRKALELLGEELRRRIAERVEPVPAADLDPAELGMVVRRPALVRDAAELLVAPADELQVVLGRMVAEPVDVLVLL